MRAAVPKPGRAERAAALALLGATVVAAATILYLARDLTFFSDELDWLVFGDNLDPRTLLTPHNGHLIALPRLIYEVLPWIFGAEYLPFRLLALASFLACVWLFFGLARRRLGGLVALAPSVILLFFGSAAVIVLSPLALPFTLSIAFGLAALLALDGSRPRDALALTLLALSLLSHSFGGLVALGAALYMLLGEEDRRRLWVPVVPLALYAVWWIWARQFDQSVASLSNITEVPGFVLGSAVATLAALTGFAGPTLGSGLRDVADVAEVLFVAAAAVLFVVLVWRQRARAPGRWLWAYLLILLAYWVALGFAEGPGREPTTPRYLFFGAIMLLLVAAARARALRLTRAAVAAMIVLFCVSLGLNVSRLVRVADGKGRIATTVRAQLGALEIAGGAADPGFIVRNAGPPASKDIAVTAAGYLAFAERRGALGYSLAELESQPRDVRAGADFVLARSVPLLALPADQVEASAAGCRLIPGGRGTAASFELEAGLSLLRLSEPATPQPLLLGRLAAPSVPVGELDAERFAVLEIPEDGVQLPWQGEVAASVEVCDGP
jgi:hypothetical protein